MGLFDFSKKKKESKKESSKKEFERGSEGIVFRTIIELLGAPKSYIEKTMKAYLDKIEKNPNYKVLNAKIIKPKKVKKVDEETAKMHNVKEDLFSTYAELEIGVKNKGKVFDFCFDYMPSSVEVIEPMKIGFSADELSRFLSDIQATLHKIDFALKKTNAANKVLDSQNQNLRKNMVRMLRNNVILALKEADKELKELAKSVGIGEDQLKVFIENMIKDNEIKLQKNKYSLVK